MAGDTYQFDLSHSCFQSEQPDDEIIRRLTEKDIHPTGVLWGRGNADVSGQALAIEQAVVEAHEQLAQGLIASGVDRDRRALRVNVQDLHWQFLDEASLELTFTLPAGSFATSVLREIIQ